MLGDIDASIEKLRAQLRQIRYPATHLDMPGLREGRPISLLPILHYAFLDFSSLFSRFLSDHGHELRAKNDQRFLEGAYKVMRDYLGYSPVLTIAQFFQTGFAARKVMFCQDVLRLICQMHNELGGGKPATRSSPQQNLHPHSRRRGRSVDELNANHPPGKLGSTFGSEIDATSPEEESFGGPQPPPTPFSLEANLEQDSSVSATKAGTTLDVHRANGINSVASPFQTLRALLEEIKAGLDQRFSKLEERFDACIERFDSHVESADARTTVLEGQVRILSVKLQEFPTLGVEFPSLGVMPSRTGSTAKGVGTPTTVGGIGDRNNIASPQPPSLQVQKAKCSFSDRTVAVGTAEPECEPFWSRRIIHHDLVAKPCTAFVVPNETQHSRVAPRSASEHEGSRAPSGVAVSPSIDHSARVPSIEPIGYESGMRYFPVPRFHSTVDCNSPASSPSAPADQDTKALIDKLTCKFQDTQDLLTRTKAKIYRAGVDEHTAGTGSQHLGT